MARLVHNTTRDEDQLIEELLEFTLDLRKLILDKAGVAATLNSLGSLYEKQQKWDKAEIVYKRSLDTRMMMYDKEEQPKERKLLAQQAWAKAKPSPT